MELKLLLDTLYVALAATALLDWLLSLALDLIDRSAGRWWAGA